MEQAFESLRKALAAAARRRHQRPRHALLYPICPAPRVAVLGLELDGPRGTYCLPDWSAEDLRRIRPQALAGWWNDLSEVARRLLLGDLDLPELQFPLVVFSRPSTGPLPARCHDLLWHWFRLPTFEQIRTEEGELLAAECAARCGFHLAQGVDASRLPLAPSALPCPCGDPAPLLQAGAVQAAAG